VLVCLADRPKYMKLGKEWRAKGAERPQVIVQNRRTYLLAINSQHAIAVAGLSSTKPYL
jgi:hypothetical protein